jgi:hypothetical protein
MGAATHQTIKLTKGKHKSPEHGACVMELASMLAGEQFTDHPAAACPVTGAFLRAYNDSIDDAPRQDLYLYAAKVVGSRGSEATESARLERLIEWTVELRRPGWTRFLLPRRLRRLGGRSQVELVAARAAYETSRRRGELHLEVLALIDELLEIGDRRAPRSTAPRPGHHSRQSVEFV